MTLSVNAGTGDLGRIEAGELIVSGRIKEIIIIRAKKYSISRVCSPRVPPADRSARYHPEDIEALVLSADEASQLLRPGPTPALSSKTIPHLSRH